jgi:DNA polymerase III sliding clamp (beta) subunit (PCNA family)
LCTISIVEAELLLKGAYMHIVVPTGDFLRLLSRLKPLRSIVTTGFSFPIYTLEASNGKIRLIISDNTTIVASSEIFATVNEPGTISVNGNDFFQIVAKIPPVNNANTGSAFVDLKTSGTKATLTTSMHYAEINKSVNQKRVFTLVSTVLSARDDFNPSGDSSIRIKLPATYLSDVFKVLGKTVANYTSDMAGLAGVLIRCKSNQLFFVVSDGFRIIEIAYPTPVNSKDFSLIIPKLTCSLLQSLIYDGDELEIMASSNQVKFKIDTAGLVTSVISSLVVAYFPAYESVFTEQGKQVTVYTRILADNISNVRRVLEEEPYRVKMVFDKTGVSLTNLNQGSHVSFSNEQIPILSKVDTPFTLIINAMLIETSLAIIGSDTIQITIPPDNKPIIVDNCDNELRIKIAIALAEAD